LPWNPSEHVRLLCFQPRWCGLISRTVTIIRLTTNEEGLTHGTHFQTLPKSTGENYRH
jgi:hypothetical protein